MLLETAIIAGSLSIHTGDTYAPKDGYNSVHDSLGIEVLQDKPEGWVNGLQAFRFADSYGKTSHAILGETSYKWQLPAAFEARAGLAAGYTHTSYYEGVMATPFVELGQYPMFVQVGYVPSVAKNDGVVMFQFKWKIGDK